MSSSDTRIEVQGNRASLAVIGFTTTVFFSAALLFFVQPLFAKLALPKIGGAPAIWTTAMLFFQIVLLLGYVYAHVLTRYVSIRWQFIIHLGFWGLALLFLPLAVSESWTYDASGSAPLQTLWLFALGVGVPFALLSANAPLLQAWYTRSGGPSAQDPYFLYAASNAGSLLALLAFPFFAEPLFGAQDISRGWSLGFVLFGLFLALCGALACSGLQISARDPKERHATTKPQMKTVGAWIFIAFIPSSLMLSVTTKISSDFGAVPMIWVIPLAIYIFSFVAAFSNWRWVSTKALRIPASIALAAAAVLLADLVKVLHVPLLALVFVPVLFVLSTYAHRMLYEMRPDASQLTLFYISMSIGGALGGLFNSIVAPIAFSRDIEALLTLLLAGGLFLKQRLSLSESSVRTIGHAIVIGLAAYFALSWLNDQLDTPNLYWLFAGFATVLAAMLLLFRSRPEGMMVALAVVFVPFLFPDENAQFRDRSFFGTHTVYTNGFWQIYRNGTTLHGLQRVDELGSRPIPRSYYHPEGPMAQVLTSDYGLNSDSIGIVGLGTGSLACYAQPHQTWDFFEIDEMVDRVARDPALFSFMSECAPDSLTHLGDARIVIEQKEFDFDILVLDAYSSDSIPVHLITTEAVQLYLNRLTDDGVLVFHISNRYYDLAPPLARIAGELGLSAALQRHALSTGVSADGAAPSHVVILSPDPDRIAGFTDLPEWQPLTSDGGTAWTDDRANLLSSLKMLQR